MAAWANALQASPQLNDSAAFEAVAHPRDPDATGTEETDNDDPSGRLYRGLDGTVSVGTLNVASFANGHTYCVQRLFQVCAEVQGGGNMRACHSASHGHDQVVNQHSSL